MEQGAQNCFKVWICPNIVVLSERLRVTAPNQSLQPTLDRSVVSLSLHFFAVKRG